MFCVFDLWTTYVVSDAMVLDRPAQEFSDLIDQFVIHVRVYGDVLYRWGLNHKRLEQSKPISQYIARRYSTQWHNIGDASSLFYPIHILRFHFRCGSYLHPVLQSPASQSRRVFIVW
jgi:hypothetical protein